MKIIKNKTLYIRITFKNIKNLLKIFQSPIKLDLECLFFNGKMFLIYSQEKRNHKIKI